MRYFRRSAVEIFAEISRKNEMICERCSVVVNVNELPYRNGLCCGCWREKFQVHYLTEWCLDWFYRYQQIHILTIGDEFGETRAKMAAQLDRVFRPLLKAKIMRFIILKYFDTKEPYGFHAKAWRCFFFLLRSIAAEAKEAA